jgi:hypothetical protein
LACAAFTTPKLHACPGTSISPGSSQVICRNTPEFVPPLYACPVECWKRGPKPSQVAAWVRSRMRVRILGCIASRGRRLGRFRGQQSQFRVGGHASSFSFNSIWH